MKDGRHEHTLGNRFGLHHHKKTFGIAVFALVFAFVAYASIQGGGGVSFNGSAVDLNGSQLYNGTFDGINETLNFKVNKSGDRMTGELINASFDERFVLYDNGKSLGGMTVWDCTACSNGSYNFYTVNLLWNSTSAAVENTTYTDRYGVELMALGSNVDAFFRWFVFPPNSNLTNYREFMRWQNSTNMFTLFSPTNMTISALAGTGNAFACIDANGKLFRSVTACA